MIYRTHRANVGGKDIHLTWTSDCVSSCYSNRQVWILKITTIKCQLICMASRPKSLAVTKISKISESPDIWGITILREPQCRIKFSTNFAVGIARIRVHTQWALTIVCGRREKVSAFSLFVCHATKGSHF